jgi:hypothetical protein
MALCELFVSLTLAVTALRSKTELRFTSDPRHYNSHGGEDEIDRDSSTTQPHRQSSAPAYILGTGPGHVVCPG